MQPDPTNLAVTLAYQEEEGAPRVVANGRGLLAQAIKNAQYSNLRSGGPLRLRG